MFYGTLYFYKYIYIDNLVYTT